MISGTGSVLLRAAASSMASGSPSRCRHNSTTSARAAANPGLRGSCPLDEQRRGVVSGERSQRDLVLPVEPERLSAGRHDPQPGASGKQTGSDRGRGIEHVLAIVEDDDDPAVPETLDRPIGCGRWSIALAGRGPVRGADGRGHRFVDGRWINDRRELDQANLSVVGDPAADLERQPRLPRSGRPDDRHQLRPRHRLLERSELVGPTDERRQRRRQCRRERRPMPG